MSDNQNFFEKFGMTVYEGKVELGKTYPIYAMITNILNEELDNIIVELNYNIEASIKLDTENADKLRLLKERAFEPGVFVCQITEVEPKYKAMCHTVIFGKKQTGTMQ